ncbi:Uncharacterized membrane protein YhaH, DUF805 family [Sphingobacterium nematocida]|uniref:Uncharacterized membrane protein YhaH, DUF805 family n=1 Tax=Sphingobacterium nematocida TaxID=1513896 RepID=A0A1T5GIB5_9SPHI|nr:DUF805 domain-containing protein [Sphingobacterium nematocida]SKC08139.1 Uncharacterized membrane protein YhaH, DUF805 family [Sphingobacterium nematocida]
MREYYYAKKSEKFGPFSLQKLRTENISKKTLIWFEGLPSWQFAKDLDELQEVFESPVEVPKEPYELKSSIEDNTSYGYQSGVDDSIPSSIEHPISPRESKSFLEGEVLEILAEDKTPVIDNLGFFKAPFSCKGRIRRTEWWITVFVTHITSVIIGAFLEGNSSSSIAILFLIPLLWFSVAQAVKRCHDRGNSGWYLIIPFYTLWMAFGDSSVGTNEYGTNPKGRNL